MTAGLTTAPQGGPATSTTPGAVLEALAGIPGSAAHAAVSRAVTYISRHQDRDGGFPAFSGAGSDAQSTAWAVQGLIAAGVNPSGLHRAGRPSPLDYLRSLIAPDGHVRYSRSTDQTPVWVTAEAVMALAGKPLPITAPRPRSSRSQPASIAQHTKATTAQHGSAGRPAAPRAPSRPAHRPQASAASPAMRYLGLLDALVLAPVGLG